MPHTYAELLEKYDIRSMSDLDMKIPNAPPNLRARLYRYLERRRQASVQRAEMNYMIEGRTIIRRGEPLTMQKLSRYARLRRAYIESRRRQQLAQLLRRKRKR